MCLNLSLFLCAYLSGPEVCFPISVLWKWFCSYPIILSPLSSCTRFFSSELRIHMGFVWIVTYACKFSSNSHVCLSFEFDLDDWELLGEVWMLLSLPGYYWCLSTASVSDQGPFLFDFLLESVLVILFPFCCGISALDLFYLSVLLGYYLIFVVGFGSCRVFCCFHISFISKIQKYFIFGIFMHFYIFHLHGTFITFSY